MPFQRCHLLQSSDRRAEHPVDHVVKGLICPIRQHGKFAGYRFSLIDADTYDSEPRDGVTIAYNEMSDARNLVNRATPPSPRTHLAW